MKRPITRKKSTGFTLLEVMVSVIIFVLLMAAVYSIWAVCYRATEQSFNGTQGDSPSNILLQRLQQSIRASVFHKTPKDLYSWSGGSDRSSANTELTFVTALPPDAAETSYQLAPLERIMIFTKPSERGKSQLIMRAAPFTMEPDEWQREVILLDDVEHFEVQYWDSENSSWMNQWSDKEKKPGQIKIGITLAGEATSGSEAKHSRSYRVPPATLSPQKTFTQAAAAPAPKAPTPTPTP